MSNIDLDTNKGPIFCYKCNNELDFEVGYKISRQDECTVCKASLYCCKMCVYFDPMAYNECHENIAERILDKEKANFCTYFILARGVRNNQKKQEDLLSAADALFKN